MEEYYNYSSPPNGNSFDESDGVLESYAEVESIGKELGLISPNSSFMNLTPRSRKLAENARNDIEHSFELADAESERECLQDKFNGLSARNEELESQYSKEMETSREIRKINEMLTAENDDLKKQLKQIREERDQAIGVNYFLQQQIQSSTSQNVNNDNEKKLMNELLIQKKKYDELEFKFAESRSALARAQQALEDNSMSRDVAENERNHDRIARQYAEKERDAYAAAYEASLKHFDKTKQRRRTLVK